MKDPVGPVSAMDLAPKYRRTFLENVPTHGPVWVHHAIESAVLKLYRGLFTRNELDQLSNLRGIPSEVNASIHLSMIRTAWNGFYEDHRDNPPTRKQVIDYMRKVDKMLEGSIYHPGR